MKLLCSAFATILLISLSNSAISTNDNDYDNWDRKIFQERKSWTPIITSGPTILVDSNKTTIHDKNGDAVNVQLSNNNVGIGNKNQFLAT